MEAEGGLRKGMLQTCVSQKQFKILYDLTQEYVFFYV